MEPDISILRKTGHFYFALTRSGEFNGALLRGALLRGALLRWCVYWVGEREPTGQRATFGAKT
jgi:hypothetical protein